MTMSSTLEGTLRFIAVMLILILPGLAVYLNRSLLNIGVRRDPASPKTPRAPADRPGG
jgi:hypothetical protein